MNKPINQKVYYEEGDAYEKKSSRLFRMNVALKPYAPQEVLDVGCGQGYFVKFLRNREQTAIGMDSSKYAGKLIPDWFVLHDAQVIPWPFTDKQFDVVLSMDFFEHLEEADIEPILNEMKRVGEVVIAWVCYKHEKRKSTPDTHLTVRKKNWWQEKLKGAIVV